MFEDELEESDEDVPPMFPWEGQGMFAYFTLLEVVHRKNLHARD